ncbi:fatty acyl-AMP ligase [Actinomadura rudentiformis]|nr:fatty acyl-AMP ligase [Actinomadura rudentiformis]
MNRIDWDGGLAGTVHDRALARPNQIAMSFVDHSGGGDGRLEPLTYGDLDTRVRTLGNALRGTVAPGSRVAILCPTGPEYVTSFLACLYSGVIAVPLFMPEAFRHGDRLALAIADAQCEAAITVKPAGRTPEELGLDDSLRLIHADEFELDAAAPWKPLAPRDTTAYLQYTSGSTRHPAGVRVTHRNMEVAVDQLASRFGITPASSLVSWLPFFHDMGLVYAITLPLAIGMPAVHMTPFAFVQQPRRWLDLISRHGATHTVSPNFGLDLCVDRIPADRRAGLDLSRLRCLTNGSEPVRARSLERFTEAYAPYGFRAAAHTPAYGLAEATLMVAGNGPDREPLVAAFDRAELGAGRVRRTAADDPDGHTMVGCGAAAWQDVWIVDPATGQTLAPDRVGEIWVRGGNVCDGYWNDRERTGEVFGARLDGESGWLRTGDLGFFYGESLFITGRLKDLIIVDGRNHHPVDIESTVEDHSQAVRSGHVVAFGIDTGAEEQVVIVAEVRPDTTGELDAQHARLRRAVVSRHDVDVHDVVFVRRGTLPKTSSGKLRRGTCREMYRTGRLAARRV